ncbi:MAG: NAD(P)H-binding protein [Sediminicola sp.]|tara:strand:+ start:6435 stop:7073 length:639 start_codon:yes stop_codon:yes gene_type:complete
MKILVIGSTGRVGRLLVHKLLLKDHFVVTGSRQDGSEFKGDNTGHVKIDLTWDVETIAAAIPQDTDAIYFVSGSRGKNLLQIDLHGAIKTMQAADQAGIRRYLMLSSVFSLQPERWNEAFLRDLTDYNIAKHYADKWLIESSGLDYTILQPGALQETTGSGKIKVNIDTPGTNSIENVVDTLIACLGQRTTLGKVITMHDGDTEIEEALALL